MDEISAMPLETIKTWLESFNSKRVKTQGLPLWALKVTDTELQHLTILLQQLFLGREPHSIFNRFSCRGRDKASEFDQLFTLYISTWLQRNYKGEKSRWSPVLENIGIKHNVSLMPSIYQSIDNGLAGWGISVHSTEKRDQYFATLYCQGGFPRAGLVGLNNGPVPNYLNSVIQQYSLFHHTSTPEDIALKMMESLPVTLRQKPFAKLAADLISCLLSLRDEYHLYSESEPVLALDIQCPKWRERLPFLLCDEEAYELIQKLLRRTAQLVTREQNPVRISRYIERGFNSWQLVAETHINKTIHPDDLNRIVGFSDLPLFFDLYTQTESGERFRSASFNLKGSEIKRWQVILNQTRFYNDDAASVMHFELWTDGNKIYEDLYHRGDELNPNLPWIFSESGERYRFLGQGSIKVDQDSVLVVFSGDLKPANILSSVEVVGELGSLKQTIYRVEGQAYAQVLSGKFTITTLAEETTILNCWLEGERFIEAISPKYAYKGIPNIYYREGSGNKACVPLSEIYWQALNSSQVYSLERNPVKYGLGIISWSKNGELKWQSKCALLPKEADFELVSYGHGELELKIIGFGNDIDVGLVEEQSNWLREVDKYEELYLAEIQLPRKMSDVINPVICWNSIINNKITFELATQQSGVCLLTPEGRPFVHTKTVLTLDDLYSHKLKIQLPPNYRKKFVNVSAVLIKNRNHEAFVSQTIELEGDGSQIVSSSVLAKLAQLLFNQSSDLRDVVTFRFFGDEELESVVPKVECYKYHVKNFIVDDELVGVKLVKSRTHKNREGIKIYAAPMWDLNREHIELERYANPYNDLIFSLPSTTEYGPWFLYSSLENRIQPRAVIISSPKTEISSHEVASNHEMVLPSISCDVQGLSDAIRDLKFSSTTYGYDFSDIDRILEVLANDIYHDDWQVIQGFVEALDYAEPNTFHVINRLLYSPKALALLLLKQSDPRHFENVWQMASKMPFEWLSLSVATWKHAIKHNLLSALDILKPLNSVFSDKQYNEAKKGLFFSKLEPLISKGEYFKTLAEFCLYELFDIEPEWFLSSIWEGEGRVVDIFYGEKSQLFLRHQGKLLRNVQNKTNDFRLRELLNTTFSRELLPGTLKGFVQPPSLESEKADQRAIVLDLPIKVAFNNMNVFRSDNIQALTVLDDSEQLLLNFALSRLQQFDRQWLQASMACAVKATILYKLESMDE
ncbi:STY4851/ECs_5259 family protein [Vibrio rotiferianus]|uniref:STY4851/ECs_5259 family protein n=1 Tax=Vibrio rotiferianus TaxID=190895 RepID=UPI0024907EFE|nr:STY4851/ECs_5259 family protein [Vibrio rotiferianus]